MEEVPSPLKVGSPVATRNASEDRVPTALRAGSPAVGSGTPTSQARPGLTRQNTSGSDRLSQLFPSRPASIASVSPLESPSLSRRTSYPSPLIPAAEPSYRIPRAPAPPSFSDDTSYSPSPDAVSPTGSQSTLQSRSGTNRLLNRLASLRSARSRGGNYNRLEDEESGRRRLQEVEEVDEPLGYDLSGLDGGVPMQQFGQPKKMLSAADAMEAERDLHEAGYAAEFERLEAQLGAGMATVTEVPFTHATPSGDDTARGHRRGLSDANIIDVVAKDAQEEAEKTGGIVAVAEIPVDISDMAGHGTDFDSRASLVFERGNNNESSYFFPSDPNMPSWRPFSMGWPFLTFLVVVALALAGLQEFLCQLSQRAAEFEPGDQHEGGLVKFKNAKDLTVLQYFTWKYAPILFFVIYGILWQIVDYEVKRLEPYYQLSKKDGSAASESLNMDYLTFMSWLVPLRALRHKQYAVIYVSMATLLASSLVPILQSASVEMYPDEDERDVKDWKAVRIQPVWSRFVTICLVIVAILGMFLMKEMRRKSGLLSNPQGIAGVAAMATRSHILADFHGLDTAPLEKIHKQLRHRRYILHKSSLWQGAYIRNVKEKIPDTGSDPRPLMLRLKAGIPYICYLISFAVILPVFLFVEGAQIVTKKLPFLLTTLATVVKLLWNTMNGDIRTVEPYHILAQRRAPAKTLTLDYTGTNPIILPFKALVNRHYIVCLVGVGSILAEVLTVCVSSFSVDGKKFIPGHSGNDSNDGDDAHDRANTDQTFRSFWSSFVLSIGIIFFLVGVACVVYVHRSHKFMPRQVGTMASVLAFIHQSKMLVNFVDTEKFDSKQMTLHLEKSGKTYALGWFQGRDGDDHCGIDEEPILAPYNYGVDWTKARVQGHTIGTWEHY
ncbi:uncharacterized protein CC84DRAFT_563311 [Paraphaeosphaeria sporulosa]|uniref:Uncharacterized protein n=1 Tax=Paraphaeosphaeria sporulosa TaxID=1460663 RepID=A0A177CLV8_9PLEO|nr:uncharacterized protein CC84DRAFT_563311 [Paraphaeosphaeria sporulosa]OAG08231.1 hypothetical protein CC84DRAFT_563311 [Paraphaeosphaeria sporulosa]